MSSDKASKRRRVPVLLAIAGPCLALQGLPHLWNRRWEAGIGRLLVGLVIAAMVAYTPFMVADSLFDEDDLLIIYLALTLIAVGIYVWLWVAGIIYAVRGNRRQALNAV